MVRFVVMAAGQATRMGRDKLIMPWGNTTVLGSVLQTVLESFQSRIGSLEIYVVARHPIEIYVTSEIRAKFSHCLGTWLQVPNPQPLAETIRLGLQNLSGQVEQIGFLPGDQVGVTAEGLKACLEEVLLTKPDFLVPLIGSQTGSPVFFHSKYVPELLALQGEQGGKNVLQCYPERWQRFQVEEGFFRDLDTPEQYYALLQIMKGPCI